MATPSYPPAAPRLRETELVELLDHTQELICATAPDDVLTYANAAWARALGFGATGGPATLGAAVAQGHQEHYRDLHRRARGGEALTDVEMVFDRADGHRVVCRGRITPRMHEGRVAGIVHAYLDVTATRRAEAVRARLAATLEATTDIVGISTQDGQLAYLNAAGRAVLGIAPDDDLSDVDLARLRPPGEHARIRDIATPIALREGVWQGESVLIGATGEEIPVSLVLVAHPSTWPGEAPYFVSAVMRDLRERVNAERTIRESEARKQSILDTALDSIITVDHQGRVLEFNPAAETMFGYLREEAIGQRLVELVIPERFRLAGQHAFAQLSSGDPRLLDRLIHTVGVRGDGSEFICEFSITRLPVEGPPLFTAFLRDITTRKTLEDALETERGFLVAVLENLTEGVVACDAGGRPSLMNRALRTILGVPDDAPLPGLTADGRLALASDGLTPLSAEDLPLARALRGEVIHNQEFVIADAVGATRVMLASGRQIVDRAGARHGAVIALHDVTEQRRVERLKSQLIRTVSHEIRTPLTAIRGALDLLERRTASAGAAERELIAMASRNVSHLARMANDLLDVERIESGAATLEQEWIDAGILLDTARDITRTLADAAGVSLDVPDVSLDVWGDPGRLVQVLTNLMGNAIKFSPPGGRVTATAQRFDDDTAICFVVSDEGRGIPEEHLDTIFEPFAQVEAADAQDHAGAGLGLTISRAIVRQHGGTIWAESEPGRGSTFRFVLPAYFDQPPPPAG